MHQKFIKKRIKKDYQAEPKGRRQATRARLRPESSLTSLDMVSDDLRSQTRVQLLVVLGWPDPKTATFDNPWQGNSSEWRHLPLKIRTLRCTGNRHYIMAKANVKKICTEVKYSPEQVFVNEVYKRRYTNSEAKAFTDVIKKSIRNYEVQVKKNCEVRLLCIEQAAKAKFQNMNLFWTLYMQRADVLLNSRRFVIEAQSLGENPITLATNIVAHGANEIKKVASFGITGSHIKLEDYSCQIVPDAVIKRFMEHPEEFYPQAADSKEATVEISEATVAKEVPAA